jgi:hypothetical protein
MGKLDERGVRGGAYIGVGPEQSFSYIARTRPAVAFIIDIRRDNQLLHLFLKAIFERAGSRLEYLCLLYSRPCPAQPDDWRDKPLPELLGFIDRATVDSAVAIASERSLLDRVLTFGVPVSAEEILTLRRLHGEFVSQGLDLQFSAYGRRAIANFPTVRELYLGVDLVGTSARFLATDTAFRVVRDLERADRVIPVVGDLGGPHAVKAIGRWLSERQVPVSLLYVSNVEYYLMRSQTFEQFADNIASLPRAGQSLLIRSYFSVQTGMPHPNQRPGHLSVHLLESVDDFVRRATGSTSYWSLVTDGAIPLDPDR